MEFGIKEIVSALIGGLFSLMLFPLFRFFVVRCYNRQKLHVRVVNSSESDNYCSFGLAVRNNSWMSLYDVHAYVTIDNSEEDIYKESMFNNRGYCAGKVEYGMLSWAKVVENRNRPGMTVHAGEEHLLNMLRVHDNGMYIEVASEDGFMDKVHNPAAKPRIFLRSNRDYQLELYLTADNIFRKSIKLHYKSQEKVLLIVG